MLCFMNKKKFLLLSLLFLFSLLFSSVFLNSENSFALEDLVFTSNAINVCPSEGCYSVGYRYIIVTVSPSPSWPFSSYANILRISYSLNNDYSWSYLQSGSSFYILDVPSSYNIYGFNSFASGVTVTISDHLPSSLVPSPPTGNLDISENGTYDVTSYATATVNVENEVIYGDYHNDLITINNSILTCGAICLVIYFFYCIYRIIIKNSGVK